jgi:hypothetical protein
MKTNLKLKDGLNPSTYTAVTEEKTPNYLTSPLTTIYFLTENMDLQYNKEKRYQYYFLFLGP